MIGSLSAPLLPNKGTEEIGWRTGIIIAINMVSSVGIVMTNKALFTYFLFDFGTTLTVIHFTVTALCLWLIQRLGFYERKIIPIKKIIPLSLSFCGFVLLTNLSLQMNSVGLYQMAKVLTTPCVVLLQFIFYQQRISLSLQASLLLCCVGVVIATVSEVHLQVIGLLVALMGVIVTSLYQILVGSEQKALNVDALQLLSHQAPLSAAMLCLLIPAFDPAILDVPLSLSLLSVILLSSLFAVAVNISSFLIIGHTSPLTYNVVGHSKLCLILLGGYTLFDGLLSRWNLIGVSVALLGIFMYTNLKMQTPK